VDALEATSMNLWLSPHGIWYFRKVTTLPCGRRKEIKKTLRTRDKSEAKRKVLELLACVRSGGKTRPDNPLPSSFVALVNLRTLYFRLQASGFRLQASEPIMVPSLARNQVLVRRQPADEPPPEINAVFSEIIKAR
jgi:hypothetical protein